ncbi:cation diffusion facilitator family transporter [Anaerorhabdus sp.]|uniref:cation diffusion facilitator family transporter n=1 Tax=Anaerorhabdus sp. TaxID=1872524 RepID=UPI002B1FBD86|nr:cation diffusion facilitator family transporter [Anaerorhabdus sp.]MEA4873926.1 cation diffusion facilitator family transporter [Anaerorhabdus sp.]
MINFLVKRFVKNYNDIENEKVRSSYGTLSSLVGIVCNVLLFAVKLTLGFLTNSIAITSDAFNNLSDSASCIVTLFGYKLAAKPADRDHPFGHGRIEYIVSFIISVIILLVGFELFKTSVDKLLNPEPIIYSTVVLISLILSIFVKLWMSLFNRTLGKKINNSAMIATSKDSLNDVIATSATMIALVGSLFTTLPLDGAMGILVSIFVFISGIGIIRSTIDELIGQPVEKELVDKIKAIILANPKILGIHDLIIHNYGPGNMIGSVHVEVDCTQDFLVIHDLVDEIERRIEKELHIIMTIHMDPIQIDDVVVNSHKELMKEIIASIDPKLSMHDFRVVIGPTHTNLIFDLQVPFEFYLTADEIKNRIDTELTKREDNIYTVITFEHGYY